MLSKGTHECYLKHSDVVSAYITYFSRLLHDVKVIYSIFLLTGFEMQGAKLGVSEDLRMMSVSQFALILQTLLVALY